VYLATHQRLFGRPADGLRHRAAIGITEATDAIAVVVSEERGSVSIAHNGRMIRRLDAQRLEAVLRAFYQPQLRGLLPPWLRWILRLPGERALSDRSLVHSTRVGRAMIRRIADAIAAPCLR